MGKILINIGYVFGFLLSITGLVFMIVGPKIVHDFITSNIKLEPATDVYKSWLNPPLAVFTSFYLFNLKNPQDFVRGAKPMLEEIGPMVYEETIIKANVTDNHNLTLSFTQKKQYKFRADLSKYNESFEITTVNMAVFAILDKIKYSPKPVHDALDLACRLVGEKVTVTKTVKEMIFGYRDPLLAMLKLMPIIKKFVTTEIVGFFVNRNDTFDGVATIYTGVDNYTKTGLVEKWNGLSRMNVWSSEYANMINGTDGTIFPAFIQKEPIYVFLSDVCRSLQVIYNKTERLLNNIEVLTFAPDSNLFAKSSENEGFCTPPGNCLPSGVLNVSECLDGIPVILSSPHFLYADSKFLDEVDGLRPLASLHNTFISLEPTTGVLMKANKRSQLNVQLFRDSYVAMTKGLSQVLYPLFWLDENFVVDQKNADKFYYSVKLPLQAFDIAKYVAFSFGVALILTCTLFAIRLHRASGEASIIVINEETDDSDNENSGLLANHRTSTSQRVAGSNYYSFNGVVTDSPVQN